MGKSKRQRDQQADTICNAFWLSCKEAYSLEPEQCKLLVYSCRAYQEKDFHGLFGDIKRQVLSNITSYLLNKYCKEAKRIIANEEAIERGIFRAESQVMSDEQIAWKLYEQNTTLRGKIWSIFLKNWPGVQFPYYYILVLQDVQPELCSSTLEEIAGTFYELTKSMSLQRVVLFIVTMEEGGGLSNYFKDCFDSIIDTDLGEAKQSRITAESLATQGKETPGAGGEGKPVITYEKKKNKVKEFFKKHWQWLIAAIIVPIIAPIICLIVMKWLD